MNGPDPERKSVARELARQLARADCRSVLRSLDALGLLRAAEPRAAEPERATEREEGRVGIWKRHRVGGRLVHVREAPQGTWLGAWADVETIPAKRGPRVVLLGESVARGMHYDPFFTPALALERMLVSATGDERLDVVDLARTDATMAYLRGILPEAAELEPDAIVVFAGNNWRAEHEPADAAERAHELGLLREARGLEAVRELREAKLARVVGGYVDLVRSFTAETGIPVLHVLPEFNLCDWAPPSSYDCPRLQGDANRRWNRVLRALEDAQRDRKEEVIEDLARELIAIDGGQAATGPYVLGHHFRARGDSATAREWLERSADLSTVPRCRRAAREALRAAAACGELRLVDLPAILAERSAGALPDRRSFLDYCHMTAEGLLVAMHAVRDALLPMLGIVRPPSSEPLPAELGPSPHVAACGSLCGALYNGRFGQGYEIVRFHARRAFHAEPEVLADVLRFLQHNARPVANGLSTAYLADRSGTLMTILERLNVPKASWTVLRALRDAMGEIDPARGEELEELVAAEHGVAAGGKRDVLSSQLWSRRGQVERNGTAFHTCHEPELRLEIAVRDAVDHELDVTLRVQADEASASRVSVHVGAYELAGVPAHATWQRIRVRIPARALRRGVNVLRIVWPEEGMALLPWHRRPVWGAVHGIYLKRPVADRIEPEARDVVLEPARASEHERERASR